MQTRPLGRTGYQVSAVGLGGNRIGNMEGVPDDHWIEMIRHARDLGVTLFDSSPNYGRSEELLGQALGDDPEAVIATKCPPERGKEAADAFSLPYVRARCEESLRRFRREAIEVYQLHSPSPEALQQSAWHGALTALRAEGKIRCIAVSTNNPEMLHWLIAEGLVEVAQLEYSLLSPKLGAVLPLAEERGVGVLVQMPLSRGILSGKFAPGQAITPDHRATLMRDRLPALIERTEAFRRLDGRDGMPLAEIALRYALAPPAVSCIIPGSRNLQRVAANARAGDGPPLSEALLREIASIQRTDAP
jgi:aryl-alcohol dehydrogenase-like predicted oxidoreductase